MCKYEVCGRVCKNKGGLALHHKRMHWAAEKVGFSCKRYGMRMEMEVAKKNRQKICSEKMEGTEERLGVSAGIVEIGLL